MRTETLYLLAICQYECHNTYHELVAMIHNGSVEVFHEKNGGREILNNRKVNSFDDVIDFLENARIILSTTPDREGEAVDNRRKESRELQLA
jgi:hypothetical protein